MLVLVRLVVTLIGMVYVHLTAYICDLTTFLCLHSLYMMVRLVTDSRKWCYLPLFRPLAAASAPDRLHLMEVEVRSNVS